MEVIRTLFLLGSKSLRMTAMKIKMLTFGSSVSLDSVLKAGHYSLNKGPAIFPIHQMRR